MDREANTEQMAFEQGPGVCEDVSHAGIRGRRIPGRGNSQRPGSEQEHAWSLHRTARGPPGLELQSNRGIGNEVGKTMGTGQLRGFTAAKIGPCCGHIGMETAILENYEQRHHFSFKAWIPAPGFGTD